VQSLSKNIISTFLTQVPAILLSIIAGIFITRLLGPEGKGVFSVYAANIEILVLLFSFGTELGIVFFISNKKINKYKIQAIAISVLLISIILNFILIFSIQSEVIFVKKYDDLFYKAYLFFFFSMSFSNSIMIAFLKAKKRFNRINTVSIISAILNLSSFSILFYLVNYNLVDNSISLIFIYSIALLSINSVLYTVFFTRICKIKPNFRLSFKNEILPFYKFSFMGFLGMIINFLNYRLDIWFVQYFKGSFQLGLYALAVNFAQLVMMISKIISSVMMPYLAENNVKQRRNYFLQYSRINFAIIFFIIIILFFISDILIIFLYGENFKNSINPFKILIIGMIFTGASQLFSTYLSSDGRNDLCLYTHITGLFFTLILDALLIPRYGIIGSAYATFFSYVSIFSVYSGILVFKYKYTFIDLFIIKKEDFNSKYFEHLLFKKTFIGKKINEWIQRN